MVNLMHKLPIGIQTFEDIRKNNYLYVDKTAFVWQMANTEISMTNRYYNLKNYRKNTARY